VQDEAIACRNKNLPIVNAAVDCITTGGIEGTEI